MKEVTEHDVKSVRELVTAALEEEDVEAHGDAAYVLQHVQDDAIVRRFVRATGGNNHRLAAKRLVATARWRLKERPEHLTCTLCAKSASAHFMHAVGHDVKGRPVLFSSYIMVVDAGAKGATEHMLCEFERAVKLMPPGVESWVWIMDFRGYGRRLSDLSPTLAVNFLTLSSAHYPERLGALYILDAPSVLTPVWRWLKPMIDPVTHAKFRFVPFDLSLDGPLPPYLAAPQQAPNAPALQHEPGAAAAASPPTSGTGAQQQQQQQHKASALWAALCEVCDEELAVWVVREMRAARAWDEARRHKKGAERPVYDLHLLNRALAEAGSAQELVGRLQMQVQGGPPDGQTHSHYGTRSFLEQLFRERGGSAGGGVLA